VGVFTPLFGTRVPENPGGLILAVILAIAALFAIGLTIAAVARTSGAARGIMAAVLYPLLFFAGLWYPVQLLPGALQAISHFSPLGAAVQAMQAAMNVGFPRRRRWWCWRPTRWCSATWPSASSAGSRRHASRNLRTRAPRRTAPAVHRTATPRPCHGVSGRLFTPIVAWTSRPADRRPICSRCREVVLPAGGG